MDLLRRTLGSVLAGESATVREHSPVPAVEEAARFLAEVRADCVIAVGGGSAAVTARAASILLAENRPLHDLCTRRTSDGQFDSPRLNAQKLPQFVVPTTPSTAFVKVGSAVYDPVSSHRLALFDPKTRAKGIFVHQEFVGTAPSDLLQSATLNTLSTAVEALESPRCDPVSEALLVHSLRLVAEHLPSLAVARSSVRENLVLAAVLCGRGTDQAGGGLASVLAHALGQRCKVPNGIVNAIVLPHTMRFNAPSTTTRAPRIVDGLNRGLVSKHVAVEAPHVIELVNSLLLQLDVPRRLRDIGLAKDELPVVADAAMSDWFISRNPRKITDVDAVLGVLEAAW
jgi:alcohol dehydrogenase